MVSPFIENGCAASSQMAFPIFVHINVPLLVFIFVHIFVSIFVHIFQSLCDGKLYEIMRGNFERADRTSVIRTTVNSKVNINIAKCCQILKNIVIKTLNVPTGRSSTLGVYLHYLLANYIVKYFQLLSNISKY